MYSDNVVRSSETKQHASHLRESDGLELLGVRSDDEEEEGRIDGARDNELEHHGRLPLRHALVHLWWRQNIRDASSRSNSGCVAREREVMACFTSFELFEFVG